MLSENRKNLSKYKYLIGIIIPIVFGAAGAAQAQQLNAGFVLNKMSSKESGAYISGIIEGLAYSRYLRDKPSETGMQCIYDWYYGGNGQGKAIWPLLKRHEDKPVGVLLQVLIKKQCGE